MKKQIVFVVLLLSACAFAQTTIVEYTAPERDPYRSYAMMCGPEHPDCNTVYRQVSHLDKFDTLEAAMQFMADHQDYKLVHFYSALVAVDVKVEEKKTSEPQPPVEKTEKVYKFGSVTKKKQDAVSVGTTAVWGSSGFVLNNAAAGPETAK